MLNAKTNILERSLYQFIDKEKYTNTNTAPLPTNNNKKNKIMIIIITPLYDCDRT